MLFIKKLISSLFLPPGLIIVILVIIGVFLKGSSFLRFLALIFALFIYLISIEPIKDLLFTPLERFPTPQSVDADVIVVLGGGSYDSGFMKEDTLNRVFRGYLIYKNIKKPIIVSGGGKSKVTDAELMAQFLKEVGIPNKDIIKEEKSKTTTENAIYVSKICKQKGYKRIVLVTSGYHMRRAMKIFKQTGVDIIPYPADSKKDDNYTVYSFLPKYTVFANSVKALREHIAIILN